MAPSGVSGVWADEPFKLISTPGLTEPVRWCALLGVFLHTKEDQLSDPVVFVASHMANVHNTFIRALNTIYLQAPYITTPELAVDFFQYCQSLGSLIHLHHSTEEALLFPALNKLSGKEDLMDINVHQHEDFQPRLAEFNAYCTLTKPEDYSAEKVRTLIDSFAPALMKHLSDEIPTLMLLRDNGKKVMEAHEKFEVEVRKKVDAVSKSS
jgi:hemerythrin-like domain-containing protein